MSNSTVYSCNCLTTFASCESMDDVRLVTLVLISIGTFASCAMALGPKSILLRGAKWRDLNGAQQLTVILPFSCTCAFVGMLGSLEVEGFQESEIEAPLFLQVVMPIFLYSFACNCLQYTILVYVLFWLQVLEVKREQYLKKKAAKEASTKASAQEKVREGFSLH